MQALPNVAWGGPEPRGEPRKGLRSRAGQAEPVLEQAPLGSGEPIQSDRQEGWEPQPSPQRLEAGQQVGRGTGAGPGTRGPGTRSFVQGDLLVGLQGDPSLEAWFEVTACPRIELVEHPVHDLDAERQPRRGFGLGRVGGGDPLRLLEAGQRGPDDGAAGPHPEPVRTPEVGLDLIQPRLGRGTAQ